MTRWGRFVVAVQAAIQGLRGRVGERLDDVERALSDPSRGDDQLLILGYNGEPKIVFSMGHDKLVLDYRGPGPMEFQVGSSGTKWRREALDLPVPESGQWVAHSDPRGVAPFVGRGVARLGHGVAGHYVEYLDTDDCVRRLSVHWMGTPCVFDTKDEAESALALAVLEGRA